MKFSNGCWIQKEGTEVFTPAEVYFTKTEEHQVTLCAPTHKINFRGDTLGGINLTIKISAPQPEVLRIQTNHYLGTKKKSPEFELEIDDKSQLRVEDSDDFINVFSGTLRVEINKKNWKMTFYRGNEKITDSNGKDLAYVKTNWRDLAYDDGSDKDTYMRERLSLSVGELIYGLGERFTPFVKNGQTVDCWNEDGGTSTDQSYKNIPFYISNKGYGVFVNHPEKVSFEVSSEMVKKVQFSV
ncbi:MAG: alpha-xylosidase, partial [Mobilitalea sp.]